MKKILVFIAVLGLFFGSVKAQNPVAQPQYFLTWIKVKDSVRASIYFQGVDTLATKAYVRSLLGTKLGYSDTATMLSAYKTFYPRLAISVTNTGTSGAATYDPSTGVLNVPVYTGGGGGGSVTSVAINNASGLTGTSPITSTGTIGADTTILSTKANVIASLLGYATTSSLTAKVNVSDTATMLGYYYNKTATDALLALKQNTITLTTTGTSGAATLIGSTLNIPQYSGGGGGGTVTSVATNAATGILGGTFTTSGTISADTVLLTTHSWHKKGIDSVANVASVANALKLNISDTASMLGSYYNKTAVDSKLLLKLNISDTAAMLANYYNKTASDARYATAANLALKLNISDTAAMLGNYYNKTASDSKFATIVNLALKVNISDTSAMLGNYYNKTALNALRALDVKYTDTSSMLANYVRTANYGIVKTGQAFGVDSTLLSTKANVVALLTGYATAANLALKVNISDTSTMLSNYYNKTALNALRALDVKYTDTSTMLSPYIRTANWGTVKTGQALGVDSTLVSTKANVVASLLGYATAANLALKVNISDTSAMLTPYVRTANYGITKTAQAMGVDTSTISTKANVVALLTGYTAGALVVKYSDTATMLSSYYNKTAINSLNALNVKYTDTAGIVGNYIRTANYGTVKTGQALGVDTTLISTKANVTASLLGYAVNSLTVKYTDTATMLSHYYNTTAADSRLALKVNISDTATMLSKYYNKTAADALLALKQNSIILTTTGTGGAATLVGSTLNIPQYAGGGGGGTVTSITINNASGLTGTSPITATGTIGADTSILSTKANVTASLIGYAANALVVKYTDTTTMLANYVRTANYGIIKTGQAFGVDSTLLSTKANVTASLLGYATAANLALKVNISDTAAMLGNYYNKTALNSLRALDVKYTDTSAMLGNYIRTANWGTIKTGQALGVDSTLLSTKANVVALLTGYTAGALVVKYTDTATMLSAYYNKTASDSRYATTANLALKLNISDTAAMLGNYYNKTASDSKYFTIASATGKVNVSDTSTMLSAYYNKTATDSKLALKINYTDSSSMLSTYIRTANWGTVKTGQALGVDSSLVSTKANVVASLLGYAVNSLVVKYTDTASMLSTHPNSTFLAANLALKVNFTDTSSMLGNYVRTANYGIIKTGQAFGVDTTALSTKANVVALLTGYTAGALVVKYTDTASMLSTHPNTTLLNSSLALKQNTITLTTTGSSGVATLVGATLNIPNYSGGSGTVTNIATDITMTGGPITTTGTLKVDTTVISTKANVGALLTGYAAGSLVVKYTDTASMLSTHPNLTAVNSLNALNVKYTDTSSMLGNYARTANYGIIKTGQAFGVDSTALSTKANVVASLLGYATNTNLALKVNISDTAAMLGNYYNKTALNALRALDVKYTDTATIVSTYIRTANWGTVKTGQALGVDSTLLSTKANVTASLIGYASAASVALKVNYTDTATMLSTYVRTANYGITKTAQAFGVDTAAMSTKANVVALLTGYTAGSLVVKYTDTATMLSHYYNTTSITAQLALKQNSLTLTTTGTSGAATLVGSTLNIPQYSGGGGVTSIATNAATGILGGTITTTGTISADTVLLTTHAWHKKGIDSVSAIVNKSYYTIVQSTDSSYFTIKSTDNTQIDTVRLTGSTLGGTGGAGTVTSASVVSANGFAGTVATATTTPAITLSTTITGLLKGNGTAISAATANTDFLAVSGPVFSGIMSQGTLGYSDPNSWVQLQASFNGYYQVVAQNSSAGAGASVDFVVSNDQGTATTFYGNFGMNSSGFTGSGAFNTPNVVYLTATSGDLAIGTTTSNAIHFVVNGGATDAATISSAGDLTLFGALTVDAGTTTTSPIQFTLTGSVLETTVDAGDLENDANGLIYYAHDNGARGVINAEQFISLTAPYTLTSQTAAQKLFNSTTNGAITVKAATSYYFECFYTLSSMSATSGSYGFALGGTATLTSVGWQSSGVKVTTQTTATAPQMTYNTTAANVTMVTAGTGTAGHMRVWGIIRVNAGGTIIPQVSLGVAAAAVVGVNSYFRIVPVGTNTVTTVGNWN